MHGGGVNGRTYKGMMTDSSVRRRGVYTCMNVLWKENMSDACQALPRLVPAVADNMLGGGVSKIRICPLFRHLQRAIPHPTVGRGA